MERERERERESFHLLQYSACTSKDHSGASGSAIVGDWGGRVRVLDLIDFARAIGERMPWHGVGVGGCTGGGGGGGREQKWHRQWPSSGHAVLRDA